MGDSRTAPLGELVVNFDGRRVPVKEADRRPGPYPYYGASGVVDYVDDYLFDGEYLLIAEDGENLRTRQTPIAFLARGRFWVNNHAHVVRGNGRADTRYLMYAMTVADVASYLSGSTMPKLTQASLNRIPVPAPPLSHQRAIASILGALDDKIDLNRRTNETLEAIARAIFKSWFVDFDPVRAKVTREHPAGVASDVAALFPDRFDESRLGRTPLGWRAEKLSTMCTTQYGFTATAVDEPVGPKFLRVTDINKQPWIEWSGVPHCAIAVDDRARYALGIGDILVARMADPGKAAIIDETVDAVFASYLVRLKTRSLAHAYFVYAFLKSSAYQDYAAGAIGGSVQANMNARVIVDADVIVPPESLLDRFSDLARPMRRSIAANVRVSETLAALRDALLPKLLSGEIRVKDAERAAGNAP